MESREQRLPGNQRTVMKAMKLPLPKWPDFHSHDTAGCTFCAMVWIINVPPKARVLKPWSSEWYYWGMVEHEAQQEVLCFWKCAIKGIVGCWSLALSPLYLATR